MAAFVLPLAFANFHQFYYSFYIVIVFVKIVKIHHNQESRQGMGEGRLIWALLMSPKYWFFQIKIKYSFFNWEKKWEWNISVCENMAIFVSVYLPFHHKRWWWLWKARQNHNTSSSSSSSSESNLLHFLLQFSLSQCQLAPSLPSNITSTFKLLFFN